MHLAPLIQDLGIILAIGAAAAFVFHRLRQPLVLGYILAGTILGSSTVMPFSLVSDLPNIRVWADIGVIFLMFHLGLEFSFSRIQKLGVSSSIAGLCEITLMALFGFALGRVMGLRPWEALFLGSMLSISSTTIIMKALDEAGLKSHRFAEAVFGILIVEDLVAILLIVLFTSLSDGQIFEGQGLFQAFGELVLVIGGWFIAGGVLVPRFIGRVGQTRNDELLTLLAIGLCLALAVTAAHFQFSTALGAFIMGSLMAETRESERISALVRPLRDVFAAVFFVSIGMLVDVSLLSESAPMVLAIALLVILGKFVAVSVGALLAGHSLRRSVRAALSMGQIGEFSFILAGLGVSTGQLSAEMQAIVVSVSILTTFTTPYLIRAANPAIDFMEKRIPSKFLLSFWERSPSIRHGKTFALLPDWLKPGLGRLFINGIIVGIIFGLTNRFVFPLTPRLTGDEFLARALGYLIALLLSAPFLYAMLTAARRRGTHDAGPPPDRAGEAALRLLVFSCLTLLWIGVLSSQYLSKTASASVTIALALVIAAVFYRRLELSYGWIEKRYLDALKHKEPESPTQRAMRELAPWDAHLVRLVCHPNSSVVGQPLHATGLRKQYSLNVIAIKRGDQVITMPAGKEVIFPCDELLVLGTDEQVDLARPLIERPSVAASPSRDFSDFETRRMTIQGGSPLADTAIGESRLQEDFASMIVGIERDGRRILNPDPQLKLKRFDLIWLVGPRTSLRQALVRFEPLAADSSVHPSTEKPG